MKDPFIRVKFTKEQSFARQLAKEYFEKYPKDRYQTEVESWREAEEVRLQKYGHEYLVVIRVDIDPDTEPTSVTTKPPR
jgi:hypothetical protein